MSRKLLLALLLLGSAGLACALAHLRRADSTALRPRATLAALVPAEVNRLDVDFGTTAPALRLARAPSGAWSFESPIRAQADSAALAALIDRLTLTPPRDVLTEADLRRLGRTPRDFGLEPPRARVRLGAGSAYVEELAFGDAVPALGETYVRAGRFIYAVTNAVFAALPASPDALRRRTLVACAPEEVLGLEFRAPGTPRMKVERTAGGWRITSPAEAPADAFRVSALLADIAAARVAGFVWPRSAADAGVPKPDLLATYGLDGDAAHAVALHLPSERAERIVFGKSAGTNLVYALVRDGTGIVTVDAALAARCLRSGGDLRDTRIFPLAAGDVTSVSLSDGPTVYVLARTAGTNAVWTLSSPVAAPVDAGAAAALLDRLLHLRPADAAESGVAVTLEARGAKPVSVRVDRAVFADLPFADLRSKTLFALPAAAVRRLTATGAAGDTVCVARAVGRDAWNYEPAPGAPARSVAAAAVKKVLAALAHVRADRVETVAATPADLRRCGLDKPAFTLAADLDAAEAARRTLLLGGAAPNGGRYAAVGGADAVFILPAATVANLIVPLVE